MRWINDFRVFESNDSDDKTNKRSDRLLTDAQRNYEENKSEYPGGDSPTMLFTDVVGSSSMWSDDAKTMSIQLDKHFKIMDDLARKR